MFFHVLGFLRNDDQSHKIASNKYVDLKIKFYKKYNSEIQSMATWLFHIHNNGSIQTFSPEKVEKQKFKNWICIKILVQRSADTRLFLHL